MALLKSPPVSAKEADYVPRAVLSGKLRDFVPLPSDTATPLTKEQLDALFPPENRARFVRALLKLETE